MKRGLPHPLRRFPSSTFAWITGNIAGCTTALFYIDLNMNYFFCTYFRQSRVTATRIMIPENTNCRFVSIPRMVRE